MVLSCLRKALSLLTRGCQAPALSYRERGDSVLLAGLVGADQAVVNNSFYRAGFSSTIPYLSYFAAKLGGLKELLLLRSTGSGLCRRTV